MEENIECYDVLYEEIDILKVDELIEIFSTKEDLIVLNSERLMDDHGRYSFVCFDSFACFNAKKEKYFWNNEVAHIDNPFDFIDEQIKKYKIKKNIQLPPLQGGAVGYFGYEASLYLEKLPVVLDNIDLPDIYIRFYSNIIAIDKVLNKSWIIATGFPEKNDIARRLNAVNAITKIKQTIFKYKKNQYKISESILSFNPVISNFTCESYMQAVMKTKQYISNGDIFEANISQQFRSKASKNIMIQKLYSNLMKLNPAPYSALIKIGNQKYIISASPERFVRLETGLVETFPIKGTRKRSKDIKEDKRLSDELLLSEKDHSENVMIVDLMRNDLSKVCRPGSVKVEELCALKSFETVHHLVSKVTGILKTNTSAIDLLKAAFPPGSVTGAPKIRAMEIISEIETQERGPYCGCIGYMSFTGDMDTSVTIRTYFINGKEIFFSAGGAIVLDSDPNDEYYESLIKAKALIEALTI